MRNEASPMIEDSDNELEEFERRLEDETTSPAEDQDLDTMMKEAEAEEAREEAEDPKEKYANAVVEFNDAFKLLQAAINVENALRRELSGTKDALERVNLQEKLKRIAAIIKQREADYELARLKKDAASVDHQRSMQKPAGKGGLFRFLGKKK